MVYVLSIAFIFIATFCALVANHLTLAAFIDVPSFLTVLITACMVLAGSGSARDFLRGLRLAVSKKECEAGLARRSVLAVSLVIQALLCASLMMAFLCAAMLLTLWEQKGEWGVKMALGLLSVYGSAVVALVLLPVRARLQKKAGQSVPDGGASDVASIFVSVREPFLPYISFAVGMFVLFLLLAVTKTLLLSDFPMELLQTVPKLVAFLLGSSYVFLFASGLFKAFFCALKLAAKKDVHAEAADLEAACRAVNAVILVRFALAVAGAVFLVVKVLFNMEEGGNPALALSVPLVLVSLAFLSALFLLPVRSRIQRML